MPGRRSKPARESRRSSRRDSKNKENVDVTSVIPMDFRPLRMQGQSPNQVLVSKEFRDINEKWYSWIGASVVYVADEMSRNPCTNDVQRYRIASRVLAQIPAGPRSELVCKSEDMCRQLISLAMSHLDGKRLGAAILAINAAVVVAPWHKSTPQKEGCITDAAEADDSVDHLHDQPKTDGCTADYDGPLQHALMHRIEILIARKEYYEAIADADYMLVAFKDELPRKLAITLVGRKSYCYVQLDHHKIARRCLRGDLVRLGIVDKGFSDPGATFSPDLANIVDLLRSLEPSPVTDGQLGASLQPMKLAPVYPGLEQYREARRKLHLKDGPLSKNFSSLSAAVKFETSRKPAWEWIVASRTISPGDVVLIEQAFVSATLCTRRTNTCFACSLWVNVCYPCATCVRVVFCSPLCASGTQAQVHKRECAVMPRIGAICLMFPEYSQALEMAVRTVLSRTVPEWRAFMERQRALLGLPDDLDDRIERIGTQKKRRHAMTPTKDDFDETVFRSRKMKMLDSRGGADCSLVAAAAMQILDEHHFKPGELDEGMKNFLGGLLLRMFLVYLANAVHITGVDVESSSSSDQRTMQGFLQTGSAVYPNLAAFGRSCDPNVALVFYGDHVVARAWREIRPGEPLTVVTSRCYLFCATNNCCDGQRRHEKKDCLTCRCHACLGNWPTFSELLRKRDPAVMRMRCSNCKEEVPMRGPQCPTCHAKIRGWKKASGDLDQLVEKLRCVGKPMPISHHDEELEEKAALLFQALPRYDTGYGKLTYPMAVLQDCAFELFALMGNKVFCNVALTFYPH